MNIPMRKAETDQAQQEGSQEDAGEGKFSDPERTLTGEPRAQVALRSLETLWMNTGSLCNITCANCYIESSPTNGRLAYLTADEARAFFMEARTSRTREIGFTGGEPFLNPDMLEMMEDALALGFEVLVLTNAMQPMLRPTIKNGLTRLLGDFHDRITLRVSIDHHTQKLHEVERGAGTWQKVIEGMDWLAANGIRLAVAGRTCWGEAEAEARNGYHALYARQGWPVDAYDPAQTVLFPEMDGGFDVPEISTSCWAKVGKTPDDLMCASSRMVVKREGAALPVVLPCTLLPYETAFEMGSTLAKAATVNGGMFSHGAVKLCHPHCAKFCVLGGGSCS